MAYVNYIKLLNEVANVYGAYSKTFITLSEIIDKCVSADVQEVKHGEWIEIVKDIGKGRTITHYQCSLCDVYTAKELNYCPNCGAKMDGERK